MYKYLTSIEGGNTLSKNLFFTGKEKIEEILKNGKSHVRFLGAGGVGMYSLMRLTSELGYTVSGSDRRENTLTSDLLLRGYNLSIGEGGADIPPCDLLVYTLAVNECDKELLFAKEKGTLAVTRAEYLGVLMGKYGYKIGVSGSHGKSTVTAMLSSVFCKAQKSPTVLCGAGILPEGLPYIHGEREIFIYEACEYKDSFLHFLPDVSVFTNLELDHTDYFKSLSDIKESFLKAINLAECAVINKDDENLAALIPHAKSRVVTYALNSPADFTAKIIKGKGVTPAFEVLYKGNREGIITLSVIGSFNIYNALGAYAAARTAGLSPDGIISAISSFSGIERRMQRIGEYKGAAVIYDYAHHPTEIRATLSALREITKGRVIVIFRPHTYSRTESLFSDFISALSLADKVYIRDVDPVREAVRVDFSSHTLAQAIGDGAEYLKTDNIENIDLKRGDTLVIMGAADMTEILNNVKDGMTKNIKDKDR